MILNLPSFEHGHWKCKNWPSSYLWNALNGIFLKFKRDRLSWCKIKKIITYQVLPILKRSKSSVPSIFKNFLTSSFYPISFHVSARVQEIYLVASMNKVFRQIALLISAKRSNKKLTKVAIEIRKTYFFTKTLIIKAKLF